MATVLCFFGPRVGPGLRAKEAKLRASAAAMAPAMPRRSNASSPSGPRPPAFMSRLAAAKRSSTRTRTPPKVSSMAARRPTGPAPTTTTSTC